MSNRGIRKQKLLVMGLAVLALAVSCPDPGNEQEELGAVSGLSPADGSTTWDTTPAFSWTEVPGAAEYEVLIADSQDGLDSASSVSAADPSYTPVSALTIGQTYYWKVRAKDGAGQFGAWSNSQSLRVESDAISGLSPADGSITGDTMPSFSWTEVPGAAEYEVRIADSPAGLDSAPSVGVTGTSHSPASALTSGQTHHWKVRAKDGTGQFGAWSAVYSLLVSIGAVSGLSPADGSITWDSTPTFSWAEVAGAAEYELRIADSSAGLDSAPAVIEEGTSHRPASALTIGQTHYWQVRAKDGAGQFGPWSDALSLQVESDAVSGLSPADGSTTWNTTPTFSWAEVAGAAEYEIRIADSQAGLDSASSDGVTGTSHSPASALTIGQTHYWQVRAKDGAGQFGPWSDALSLQVESDAVSGLSPADGSTTWNTTPTFSWAEVAGAAEYEIRIADSQAGLDSASSDGVTGTAHSPASALTIGQTHYWQVRAKDGAGQFGPWSDALSLRVESDAVSGLSPADGSTTWNTTPTFSWAEVPGAAEYEIRIAGSQAGLDSASSIGVTGTSHSPASALTIGQTYYWQVRAKDGAGQFGPWSDALSLQVESDAISGLSPADGSSTWDTTPNFSWTEVPGAAEYEIRIADSQNGLDSASSTGVTGTSHSPASALTIGQTHYWQVRAKDGAGQFGPWSDALSLQVESDAVSGLSPADGSTTWNTTPTFSWAEVPGAAEYEIRIADSQAGLDSASSDGVTGTSHSPASALTIGQTHYWQVRAKDAGGQYGPWSAGQSLKVEWGAISGQSPADGSSTPDTTPTLSWNAVTDAAGYEVQLANSRAGVEAAPTQSVTGTAYTAASALSFDQTYYWRVRAKDGAGQSGAWSVAAAIQIGYFIGDTGPAGGIVFYDKGSYSDGWRYLEAAPSDQVSGEWGGYESTVGGTTTAIGSGKSNTEQIVTQLGTGNYAARICYDLELGGYDDWFLPSKDELNELYKQKDTVGGFKSNNNDSYWSSSEHSEYYAWRQNFNDGNQYDNSKYLNRYIRAVRAFEP